MADAINKQNVLDQIEALTVDGEFGQADIRYLINYLLANGELSGTARDLIQIRRGNREDLPNLVQGEMAYALDTEEIFIGGINGNVKINAAGFRDNEVTNLFVNGSASQGNGKSANSPFTTIQQAFDYIKNNQGGIYNIDIAQGVYNERVILSGISAYTTINVNGKKGVGGAPGVIVDCYNIGVNPIGFFIKGPSIEIYFKDIEVRNGYMGWDIINYTYVAMDNCIANGNTFAGVYISQSSIATIGQNAGCKIIGSGTYGAVAYHAFMSLLNTEIAGATNYGAYWSVGSGGHCDAMNIHDCYIGVAARHSSTPTVEAVNGNWGSITNCSYAGVYNQSHAAVYCVDWTKVTMTGNYMDFAGDSGGTSSAKKEVKVYNVTNQSIPNGAYTPINFDGEQFDSADQHDSIINNTRLVCREAGKYLITVQVNFASNTTGIRGVQVKVTTPTLGTVIDGRDFRNAVNGFDTVMSYSFVRTLAVNDYIEMEVYQSSGAALDVRGASATQFGMVKI